MLNLLQSAAKTTRTSKSRLNTVKVDAQKKIIPKGDTRKPRWWRVNVGKKFTGTGKQRRFFDTEAQALQFIRDTEEAMKARGKAAFDIPKALAVEAVELVKQLEPAGATLTDAVKFYLKHAPIHGKKTVAELIPLYLETKQEGEYRNAQEIALNVFARDFGSKPITSIFAPAIAKWFKGKKWEALNARNYMRDLSMFFRWAEKENFVGGNPMDKITRPKVTRTAPEVFTVEETAEILDTARKHPELKLFPMYAVALFSGVRVEELTRMRWQMIDWEEGELRLPAEVTKTHQPRNVEILPALRSALEKSAPKTGDIVSPVNLRLRREKLLTLAGVPRKRNALRHSFASYHAAKHQDPGKLQMLLGQQTPSVLFKHYVTAIRKTDAERYFALKPPYVAPKGAKGAARLA